MTELSARDAIVTELSPPEAAEFLGHLVRGYQSAYQAAAESYGSHRYLPARAMAEDLDRLALDEHWASYATGMRQPGETTTAYQHRAQAEQTTAAEAAGMACPECGEGVHPQPPADLVNWQAHGIDPPGWSHRDGSALCPVIGPSGGYQPAQPTTPPQPEPDPHTARLDPPATMRAGERGAWTAAPYDPVNRTSRAGEQDTIPRRHAADLIRRLDVTGPGPVLRGQPTARPGPSRQADREAGE